MRLAALLIALLAAVVSPVDARSDRIVSLGGTATELLVALGRGPELVGVDTTSAHPVDLVASLPQLGSKRRLSAEGILELTPTLVVAGEEASPRKVLRQLERAGVTVVRLPLASSRRSAAERIVELGKALGQDQLSMRLAAQLVTDFASAERIAAALPRQPRVLFIQARGNGSLAAAGEDTNAGVMLELSGAIDAAEKTTGRRTLTADDFLAARPDFLVVSARDLERLEGIEGLLALPGVALTPAGKNRRVVTVDDQAFLGFGPRSGRAAIHLAKSWQRGLKR
ncbi:MAG: ABC transporter substrate-binding protein [Acidobacteriota bacterium]